MRIFSGNWTKTVQKRNVNMLFSFHFPKRKTNSIIPGLLMSLTDIPECKLFAY